MWLAYVLLLTMTAEDPSDVRNRKFVSPNGEMTVVVRQYPAIGDFERVPSSDYWAREQHVPPQPVRGALYRKLPSGNQELLAEFDFGSAESQEVLVADDGHFVTHRPLPCGAQAELFVIRAPDGAIVRTLFATDIMTRHDQQWLCRGEPSDVRYAIDGDALRVTMLTTDTKWDAEDAKHETIAIDLVSGKVPAPEGDRCPTALLVVAEAGDDRMLLRIDADVVPIGSQALLDRAVVRVMPEYPEVATKARIGGTVKVELVVGRNGKIEATKVYPRPFGIEQAVRSAIANWEFAPSDTRVAGSFVFRFAILRDRPMRAYTVR